MTSKEGDTSALEHDLLRRRKEFAREIWNASKTPLDGGDDPCKVALAILPESISAAWSDKQMTSTGLSVREMYKQSRAVHESRGIYSLFIPVGTVGIFSPEDRKIMYLVNAKRGWLDYPFSWKGVVDVCGHEIGHFIDWVSLTPSASNGFAKVFKAEGHMLDDYAATDATEFFADTCWICTRFPEIAAKWIPQTAKWFEVFFADEAKGEERVND